jgi:hypothetical protein
MPSKLLQISIAFAVVLFIPCHSTSAQTNKFTTADLQKLRWIEGSWRGTGDVDKPFFERYRFEGDSVLLVDAFADATLTKVNDTTRFELKDGEFGGGSEGDRWVAKSIDDHAIEFVPAVNVRNSFRWERISKDLWRATIMYPATKDKPARQRVYQMERIPQKAEGGKQ